ncbi:CPBP family intramembrane glutamic endopeptidase [Glutamicibacter endophyticus]
MRPQLPVVTSRTDRSPRLEVLLVLALSLGQSAVYSLVSFLDKLTRAPLGEQTTSLNNSLSTRPYLDLTYQLLDILFALVPVVLSLYFLRLTLGRTVHDIGFDLRRPFRDLLMGAALFLAMGLGTLGLYAAGRALGITTALHAANLAEYWWSIPVLLLSAARHAILEEVIMLAFLGAYRRFFGLSTMAVIVVSALVRGSYHLYQGVGPFLGNFVMGLVFGWIYQRYGRVMPLVIAHFLLDAVGFVGFMLIGPAIGIGN